MQHFEKPSVKFESLPHYSLVFLFVFRFRSKILKQDGPTSDSKLPSIFSQSDTKPKPIVKFPAFTAVVCFHWFNSLVQCGLCIPGPSHWQCVLRLAQQLSGSPRVLLSDAEFHRRSFYVRFNAETISSSAEDDFHLPM